MGHYDECYEYGRQHPRQPAKRETKEEQADFMRKVSEKITMKRIADNVDKIDGECK